MPDKLHLPLLLGQNLLLYLDGVHVHEMAPYQRYNAWESDLKKEIRDQITARLFPLQVSN
jgi:hypothetical protein